jgi:hypothetical protein
VSWRYCGAQTGSAGRGALGLNRSAACSTSFRTR